MARPLGGRFSTATVFGSASASQRRPPAALDFASRAPRRSLAPVPNRGDDRSSRTDTTRSGNGVCRQRPRLGRERRREPANAPYLPANSVCSAERTRISFAEPHDRGTAIEFQSSTCHTRCRPTPNERPASCALMRSQAQPESAPAKRPQSHEPAPCRADRPPGEPFASRRAAPVATLWQVLGRARLS